MLTRFGDFRLDTLNECLWRRQAAGNEERIALPPKAYAVLCHLMQNCGRLVKQDELLDAVWPGTHIQPEGLKNQILLLRRALGDDPRRARYIETLPRRGYRFIPPHGALADGTDDAASRVRLVGREASLAQLNDALNLALDARRQLVFVTGEPGIGKSTLVDAFAARALGAHPGLLVARGQCVEGFGGTEPFYVMLEVLAALRREAANDDVMRPLCGAAVSLRKMRDALEAIAAVRPLLVVLEDLQWVDQATVDVIAALARSRMPCKLMLVGTFRSADARANAPLSQLGQEILLHGLAREIALEALSMVGIAHWVDAGGSEKSFELACLLHRQCGGNPLFILAALDDLLQRGLVARRAGGWRACVPCGQITMHVPERLRSMIESDIERMADEERQVLEAASVVGETFRADSVAAVAQLSVQYLEDACERLCERRVLRRIEAEEGPAAYEFVHGFQRDVLYHLQPAWQRASFARRVLEHERASLRAAS